VGIVLTQLTRFDCPKYLALLRALWINKVATEQQIEEAIHDKLKW
jgi:hypothetical protein